jgi:hypothetical protein
MIVLAKQWLLCKKLFSVTHAKGKRRISSARLLRALFCFETRAPAKPLEMGEGQAFILESLRKGDKTPGGNLPFGFRQASLQPFPLGFKYPAARCFRGTSRPTGYSLRSLEKA